MRTPLSIAVLVLAIPAAAGAWGGASDGSLILPPRYADFFAPSAPPAPTYDALGPFPSALLPVGEGGLASRSKGLPAQEGRMMLVGRGRRLRIQLECPPGQVSSVPDDAIVPHCVEATGS